MIKLMSAEFRVLPIALYKYLSSFVGILQWVNCTASFYSIQQPVLPPLLISCACIGLKLGACMMLARDCGLEIWEVNCVLRENYIAGTANRRKVFI